MKQCNNSSVPVNNQCDSKRLLHSSALQQKAQRINTIYFNQITSIMFKKGRQGDSIVPLNFARAKVGCFAKVHSNYLDLALPKCNDDLALLSPRPKCESTIRCCLD
jgi:hypothetical protein